MAGGGIVQGQGFGGAGHCSGNVVRFAPLWRAARGKSAVHDRRSGGASGRLWRSNGSPQPGNVRQRRRERGALLWEDPGCMTADRKPAAAIFDVTPIFFEAEGAVRAQEDIDAARGIF